MCWIYEYMTHMRVIAVCRIIFLVVWWGSMTSLSLIGHQSIEWAPFTEQFRRGKCNCYGPHINRCETIFPSENYENFKWNLYIHCNADTFTTGFRTLFYSMEAMKRPVSNFNNSFLLICQQLMERLVILGWKWDRLQVTVTLNNIQFRKIWGTINANFIVDVEPRTKLNLTAWLSHERRKTVFDLIELTAESVMCASCVCSRKY